MNISCDLARGSRASNLIGRQSPSGPSPIAIAYVILWAQLNILDNCFWQFSLLRGPPYMTSAKFYDFFNPPPVTYRNKLILFLPSAFWGPASPLPVRTSYMEAPLQCLLLYDHSLQLLSTNLESNSCGKFNGITWSELGWSSFSRRLHSLRSSS